MMTSLKSIRSHPGVRIAFSSQNSLAGILQPLVHRLTDGLSLPSGLHGHQHEGVRIAADFSDIEQHDIARLPVLRNLNGLAREIDALACRLNACGCSLLRHDAILRHAALPNNDMSLGGEVY